VGLGGKYTMANPLERYERFNLDEAYEVVRTAVVWKDNRKYRIEVLKCFSNPNTPYVVDYSVEEAITAQPTNPQEKGEFVRDVESMRVWRDVDLPHVAMPDPDAALTEALSFLRERSQRD